jgi:hypothetical protein
MYFHTQKYHNFYMILLNLELEKLAFYDAMKVTTCVALAELT